MNIAYGVRRSSTTSDGGEAEKDWRLFAFSTEE